MRKKEPFDGRAEIMIDRNDESWVTLLTLGEFSVGMEKDHDARLHFDEIPISRNNK